MALNPLSNIQTNKNRHKQQYTDKKKTYRQTQNDRQREKIGIQKIKNRQTKIGIKTLTDRNRHTNRPIDRNTNNVIQIDNQTREHPNKTPKSKQTDRKMDKKADGRTNKQTQFTVTCFLRSPCLK